MYNVVKTERKTYAYDVRFNNGRVYAWTTWGRCLTLAPIRSSSSLNATEHRKMKQLKPMSRAELIQQGFLPSAQRAKMTIPFWSIDACSTEQYERLPQELQALYSATPDRHDLHHKV